MERHKLYKPLRGCLVVVYNLYITLINWLPGFLSRQGQHYQFLIVFHESMLSSPTAATSGALLLQPCLVW